MDSDQENEKRRLPDGWDADESAAKRAKPVFLELKDLVESKMERRQISTLLSCLKDDPLIQSIRDRIGKGQYAEVYEGCDSDEKCRYVIKLIRLTTPAEQGAFRIERALSIWASQQGFGPKIYRTLRCDDSKLAPPNWPTFGILVMDKLIYTLEDALASNLNSPDRLELIWSKVTAKVAQMHQEGIWHADLSGRNVMVNGGEIHIIDFGRSWPFRTPVPMELQSYDYSMLRGSIPYEARHTFPETLAERFNLDELDQDMQSMTRAYQIACQEIRQGYLNNYDSDTILYRISESEHENVARILTQIS